MNPEWMQWLEENMPTRMLEEFGSDWKHNATWRDNLIAKQTQRIAELEAERDEQKSLAFRMERAAERHKANYHSMQDSCTQRDRVIHEEQKNARGWQSRTEAAERERDAMMETARGQCSMCGNVGHGYHGKCADCGEQRANWKPAWAGR